MKKFIIVSLMMSVLAACNQPANKENEAKEADSKEISVVAASIEELVDSPVEYKDMEVAIEGMVTHVCRHGGQKCFVLAGDSTTQIRIVPAGDIDEFKLELEGSTVAFRGKFRVMNIEEASAHVDDHESKEHHAVEMSHSKAEKADIFIEATELKEI